MHVRLFFALMVAVLLLFFDSNIVSAASINRDILDVVLEKYHNEAKAWGHIMLNYASWLFWSLVLINMVWTYGMMALKRTDIQEFLAETIKFFAVTSFFWWILYNGPAIGESIIQSMRMIGAKAIGQTSDFKPGGIVQIGIDIFFKVLDQTSIWSPIDSVCGMIISIIILIVFTLIGVNLLLLFVSAWILIYGSIFFLGFGGSSWTSDIVINFYKMILAVGAQIMVMLLLIGIGKSFVDQYYENMMGIANLKELGIMLVVAIVLLCLTNKIPPMIASIIGVGGTGSIGNLGASSALSGAAIATAVAAKAGEVTAAGATSMAGGVSAIKAAFQQSQQHMAEGSGIFSNNFGGSGSGGGSGGFMSVMGTASRFAADMSKNLARGIGGVAQDKAANIMDTAKEEVGQTIGGQVASEISKPGSAAQARQNRQDLTAAEGLREEMRAQEARNFLAENSQQDSFSGDSLGAGQENIPSVPINEEVADFVSKSNQNQLNLKKEHRHK